MTHCFAPELFASTDPLRLAGSRCVQCGTVQFPAGNQCAHCAAEAPDIVELPTRGTVWTWTVQRFAPKAPYVLPDGGFTPYAVGYVDLGEVLVESVLLADPAELRIGLDLHLVRYPLTGAGDGYSFAFRS